MVQPALSDTLHRIAIINNLGRYFKLVFGFNNIKYAAFSWKTGQFSCPTRQPDILPQNRTVRSKTGHLATLYRYVLHCNSCHCPCLHVSPVLTQIQTVHDTLHAKLFR